MKFVLTVTTVQNKDYEPYDFMSWEASRLSGWTFTVQQPAIIIENGWNHLNRIQIITLHYITLKHF